MSIVKWDLITHDACFQNAKLHIWNEDDFDGLELVGLLFKELDNALR